MMFGQWQQWPQTQDYVASQSAFGGQNPMGMYPTTTGMMTWGPYGCYPGVQPHWDGTNAWAPQQSYDMPMQASIPQEGENKIANSELAPKSAEEVERMNNLRSQAQQWSVQSQMWQQQPPPMWQQWSGPSGGQLPDPWFASPWQGERQLGSNENMQRNQGEPNAWGHYDPGIEVANNSNNVVHPMAEDVHSRRPPGGFQQIGGETNTMGPHHKDHVVNRVPHRGPEQDDMGPHHLDSATGDFMNRGPMLNEPDTRAPHLDNVINRAPPRGPFTNDPNARGHPHPDNVNRSTPKVPMMNEPDARGPHKLDNNINRAPPRGPMINEPDARGSHHLDNNINRAPPRGPLMNEPDCRVPHNIDNNINRAPPRGPLMNDPDCRGPHNIDNNINRAPSRGSMINEPDARGPHHLDNNRNRAHHRGPMTNETDSRRPLHSDNTINRAPPRGSMMNESDSRGPPRGQEFADLTAKNHPGHSQRQDTGDNRKVRGPVRDHFWNSRGRGVRGPQTQDRGRFGTVQPQGVREESDAELRQPFEDRDAKNQEERGSWSRAEVEPTDLNLQQQQDEFERQFEAWEKQFQTWKEQNENHPDRAAFSKYEEQWKEWREQLLKRREQMRRLTQASGLSKGGEGISTPVHDPPRGPTLGVKSIESPQKQPALTQGKDTIAVQKQQVPVQGAQQKQEKVVEVRAKGPEAPQKAPRNVLDNRGAPQGKEFEARGNSGKNECTRSEPVTDQPEQKEMQPEEAAADGVQQIISEEDKEMILKTASDLKEIHKQQECLKLISELDSDNWNNWQQREAKEVPEKRASFRGSWRGHIRGRGARGAQRGGPQKRRAEEFPPYCDVEPNNQFDRGGGRGRGGRWNGGEMERVVEAPRAWENDFFRYRQRYESDFWELDVKRRRPEVDDELPFITNTIDYGHRPAIPESDPFGPDVRVESFDYGHGREIRPDPVSASFEVIDYGHRREGEYEDWRDRGTLWEKRYGREEPQPTEYLGPRRREREREEEEEVKRDPVKPSAEPAAVPKKSETVSIRDLLYPPGRQKRPPQMVVLLRGPPGSGKSYVAKLVKDKECENGGSAPRILCLDDYFMVESEKTVRDPETGKRVKTKEFVYDYEAEMEDAYRQSLLKSFKKTVDDKFFPFIVVDAVNAKIMHFREFWSYAKQRGFQVYVAAMECTDPVLCHRRNTHRRSLEDVRAVMSVWEKTPEYMSRVDVRSLLQDDAIAEVEMEDSSRDVPPTGTQEEREEDEEEEIPEHVPSKWEALDATEEKLDRLDGLRVAKRKHSTFEDYLQLPDDYEQRFSRPGKKRVRWADLEERKNQDRLRAIGFVVGQTDWSKITDPSHAEKALTHTKYI